MGDWSHDDLISLAPPIKTPEDEKKKKMSFGINGGTKFANGDKQVGPLMFESRKFGKSRAAESRGETLNSKGIPAAGANTSGLGRKVEAPPRQRQVRHKAYDIQHTYNIRHTTSTYDILSRVSLRLFDVSSTPSYLSLFPISPISIPGL
jgi:hypothetical protein